MKTATIGCTTRPFNAIPYEEAFDLIAAAGYTDVALFANAGVLPIRSDSSREEVVTVRTAARQSGLVPSMVLGRTHLKDGVNEALIQYRKLIERAAEVGANWLLDLGTGDEALYEVYFQLMSQAAPYAQEAGLQITMKPHGGISLTTEDLLKAVQRVDHPAFAISYDPGNIIYYTAGKRMPGEDIAALKSLVSTLIIKDCTLREGKPDVLVTPGDGLVNFATVWRNLVAGGFVGPAYVECVAPGSVEQITRNITYALGFMRGIMVGPE